MSKPIIEVREISKKYRLGATHGERYKALRDVIAGAFRLPRRQERPGEFWALQDISFDVMEGEVLGIIGRNGAGKSTLLKVLSRITEPTSGQVTLRGRVASLLEVGTGFHPELSGRENIFLNGAILGMTRQEMRSKFDEIVAFAEVERFIDTPVKRYSSGMYVRLAFAVAAHLEPEILLIDEVLAVGDAEFQRKCLGKMGEAARSGRTVLFVSHNLGSVKQLCSKGILLDRGRIVRQGPVEETVDQYLATSRPANSYVRLRDPAAPSNADDRARFTAIGLCGPDGKPKGSLAIGDDLRIWVETVFYQPARIVQFSLIIKSSLGLNIYHIVSPDSGFWMRDVEPGEYALEIVVPGIALYPGEYTIDTLWLADANDRVIDAPSEGISFTVTGDSPLVNRPLRHSHGMLYQVADWRLVAAGPFRVPGGRDSAVMPPRAALPLLQCRLDDRLDRTLEQMRGPQ